MGKVRRQEKKGGDWCPFCDEEMADSQLPFCQPCKVTKFHCPACGCTIPRDKEIEVCPECGAPIKVKTD